MSGRNSEVTNGENLTPNPRNLPIIGQEVPASLVQQQKELVAQIKADAADQAIEREARELTEKIVPLSGADLEKQRRAAVAIDGMIIKRLENGAVALEKMVCAELRQGPAADVSKAHLMMEQAKSLRIVMGFIQND